MVAAHRIHGDDGPLRAASGPACPLRNGIRQAAQVVTVSVLAASAAIAAAAGAAVMTWPTVRGAVMVTAGAAVLTGMAVPAEVRTGIAVTVATGPAGRRDPLALCRMR